MPKILITKENAKELGRKGGRNNKGKRSPARTLNGRKFCNPSCEYYPCIMEHMTHNPEFKHGKRRLCAINEMPSDVKRRMFRLLRPDGSGFAQNLIEFLSELDKLSYDEKTKSTTKEMIEYTIKVKDAVMGKKSDLNISGELKTGIDVDEFKKAMKEIKE